MSNKAARNLARKESAKNALEQMFPDSVSLVLTAKEQAKVDALATRWQAAQQNLQRQQQILQQATVDEKEQKDRLLAVLEVYVEEHGKDWKDVKWAYDGQKVWLAVPK